MNRLDELEAESKNEIYRVGDELQSVGWRIMSLRRCRRSTVAVSVFPANLPRSRTNIFS